MQNILNENGLVLPLDVLERDDMDKYYLGSKSSHRISACLVNQLIKEDFNYPEIFIPTVDEILSLLPYVKAIRFDSSKLGSGIDPLKGDGYIVYLGNNYDGDKTEMKISLIHELIHIHIAINVGIPLITRLHDYLEHEIEFAAKLFINQNKN
ncbi:hypothetical protein KC678_03570, partial [Candidatus Dojkabacteria bacterium]|nr:hypothetical protein [Candidatus Dojkabacteria bacterium]